MRNTSSRNPLSIGIRGLLITAMLVFGNTCALGNLACAGACPADDHETASIHGHHDVAAGCEGRDGCDEHPAKGCDGGAICCSTWEAAPATPSLSLVSFAAVTPIFASPVLRAGATAVTAPIPIPAESPPPLIPFLRL